MTEPHGPENGSSFPDDDIYRLRLFITGASPNSTRAVLNIKEFCENFLAGKYELEIIDVYQQPLIAETEQLIALPMLVKATPAPQRRLIGDMSNPERIMKGLNIQSK